jgi:hypothetical protein
LNNRTIAYIGEKETEKTKRTLHWFNGFGPAAPVRRFASSSFYQNCIRRWLTSTSSALQLLFIGLGTTLSTLQQFDSSRKILNPDFYFFFSKIVKASGMANPFAKVDPASKDCESQTKEASRELLEALQNVVKIIRPKSKNQVKAFVDYAGRAVPPWSGEKEITHEMTQDFSARLDALIARLESDDVSKFKLESRINSKVSYCSTFP